MTRIPGDVVVFPEPGGRWRLHNAFTRTSLVLDASGLEVVRAAEEDATAVSDRFAGDAFPVWDVQRFSNQDGLLADPSNFVREPDQWGAPRSLSAEELVESARESWLLVDDDDAYRARFAYRRDVFDRDHFPNFHQELGTHLLLRDRRDPEDWWLEQKFTDDLGDVRDNLYGAVQRSFLERYFGERLGPGRHVLDVGCGPGFYSNLIAGTGATVLGIDPSERFIEIARQHAVAGAEFEVAGVSEPGALDHIASGSADLVFISDALLFYFVPATPGQVADLDVLFADLRRILKPDGLFVSLEPHYIFWLRPWLGDPERPFTLLTEYLHKNFGVTPSISELIHAFARGGFAVTDMFELTPDPAFEAVDPRAYHFASSFPLWHLFELRPVR